jgi:hypothetical protein
METLQFGPNGGAKISPTLYKENIIRIQGVPFKMALGG